MVERQRGTRRDSADVLLVMRVMVTHGYVLMAPTPMSAGTVSHECGCRWTQIYPWATCDEH